MKKVMATAALAATTLGLGALGAPQAMALGDDSGTTSESGNGAEQHYGNAETAGDMSPQLAPVQGSLNNLCLGVPAKANATSLVGVLVPVGVQDIPVLSAPQNQQCAANSTQAKGDEPLSHLAQDFPILSGNGAGQS
ncbi:rodlin [Streptomyces sp. NPDC004111]|uniref:rodlin n=1 Tax=Streptomyces sp. NPDC004111 TaxID=3364690 RepID=UPI00368D5748